MVQSYTHDIYILCCIGFPPSIPNIGYEFGDFMQMHSTIIYSPGKGIYVPKDMNFQPLISLTKKTHQNKALILWIYKRGKVLTTYRSMVCGLSFPANPERSRSFIDPYSSFPVVSGVMSTILLHTIRYKRSKTGVQTHILYIGT